MFDDFNGERVDVEKTSTEPTGALALGGSTMPCTHWPTSPCGLGACLPAPPLTDRFLTGLRDYAEIHDAITDGGFEAIREAQRDVRKNLDRLASHGLVAYCWKR
jgi:hypothetical protein